MSRARVACFDATTFRSNRAKCHPERSRNRLIVRAGKRAKGHGLVYTAPCPEQRRRNRSILQAAMSATLTPCGESLPAWSTTHMARLSAPRVTGIHSNAASDCWGERLVVWSLSSGTNSGWHGRPCVTQGARRQARRQELARGSPDRQENRDGPLWLAGARPTQPADRKDVLT